MSALSASSLGTDSLAPGTEWVHRVVALLDAAAAQLDHEQAVHGTILKATSLLRKQLDPKVARARRPLPPPVLVRATGRSISTLRSVARETQRANATEMAETCGTVKYLKAIGHQVFSARGEPLEVPDRSADVTEGKRARQRRERLCKLQTDLAHLNRLRMVGVLAASLAHEVKQPIATMRNNARAALNFLEGRTPDLNEVREALGCIVGDADRAGDIIDRIRAHVRKAPPRKGDCDLNKAVTEAVELARSQISKHGVSLKVRLAEQILAVQGDRVQLQQVILNLILNAIEAMSSADGGPRELLISTEQRQNNGVVSVRDSGPGIAAEHVESVFEAFYTTKSNGVGIGLSLCRSIVDAHGGRLWIEANEPRGATFQFTVPSAANCAAVQPFMRANRVATPIM